MNNKGLEIVFTIRLTKEEKKKLEKMAKRTRRSQSEMVRELINEEYKRKE